MKKLFIISILLFIFLSLNKSPAQDYINPEKTYTQYGEIQIVESNKEKTRQAGANEGSKIKNGEELFSEEKEPLKEEAIRKGLKAPDVRLKIAYKQKEEGKLSAEVFRVELFCFDGQCSMETLTLNRCIEFPNLFFKKKGFFPIIQRTSTKDGNLSVILIEKGKLKVEEKIEDFSGSTNFRYSFTYVGNFWEGNEITDFSGTANKYSAILGKEIAWELVPLKGVNVFIKPACDMILPGIPEK